MTTRTQRLDSVAEIFMGQAPSGEAYNSEDEGWPLLAGAGDFRDGRPAAKKFTREAPRICLPGDIIIGVRASIGDKVIADREYCLGRGVAALRPRPEVHDRYLWHWLSVTRPKLEGKGKGATFKQVTKEDVAELEIPLPPLEEQRRIAAILDKRDYLEKRLQRRHDLLDELWKSEFMERFGNPFSRHSQRPTARLGEIASTSSGGTPKREVRAYFGGTIPWVKSGELSNPVVEVTEEFLTEDGLRNSSAKMLSPGVVLLAMYGATAGAVSILGLPACTNQAICAIDPRQSFDSLYLADFLRLITPALLAKRIGGAQPNLTQDIIRNILIPIPSKEEQESYILFRKRLATTAVDFSRSSIAASRLGSSCLQALLH